MPEFLADHGLLASVVILAVMLVAFAREWMKPSGVAVIGAAACLALGFVDQSEMLGVFSNPAVVAIGAMLILSQALVRTGTLEALATRVIALASHSPKIAIVVLLGVALVASAFLNSTPVVVIMIPLIATLARTVGIGARALLIPLSYIAILGGTCTLIGTSTNLLVNSIARNNGHPGFGVFDITRVGLIAAASGIAFLLLSGRWLLPRGSSHAAEAEEPVDIITEVRLRDESKVVGEPLGALALLKPRGVKLVRATRQGSRLDPKDTTTVAQAGDRLVLRVSPSELATLQHNDGLALGLYPRLRKKDEDNSTVRFVVINDAPIIGRRLSTAPFVASRSIDVIGLRRHRVLAGPDLASLTVKPGDEVFIAGSDKAIAEVVADPFYVASNAPVPKPFLRNRALAALATLALVVAAAAFDLLPLSVAAVIGIGFLLAVRSLDTDDAWSALHADVLILIYAMLVVGTALQNTGAVDALVSLVVPRLDGLPMLGVIVVVYFLTSVLTEMITNNGVAVIMTPIVMALATGLGQEPTGLIVAVMFAASASFATPIGYQTNTLVHIAGRYRFVEFLKIGVPMNIVVGLATCMAISLLYR